MPKKVIAIVNQKGGVGKTTTAVNISAALAIMEKKVLVIDLDPQGNTSTGFGIDHSNRKITIYQLLIGLNQIQDSIISISTPVIDIITSNMNLSAAELELASIKNREYLLSNLLSNLDYDYIIIDCPPSLNLLTVNALTVANEVLIPMQCDFYSLEGLSHLLKTIKQVEKNLNPKIKIGGILFTMYDKRNRLTEYVENDVRSCFGEIVFKTTIPRNVRLSEAPSYGVPAIIYDHRCCGSMAYLELTREILSKE